MKTNLIKKIGTSLMFPTLALLLLLFSPNLLSNVDNNEANILKQDTTLQVSPIIIIGKVVDLDHQPLEGVVVRDNSTTIEKMTDGEGKFELSLDTATVVSFTKMEFYTVDHKVTKSDSNLVVILTPELNELILEGYGSPTDAKDNDVEAWFVTDTTSTLKKKYDSMQDSIDNKSMKMDKWPNKMDSTHMDKMNDMHMNDSMKNVKKEMWKKDMKHEMDTNKIHKDLHHHKNDTIKKINNGVIDIE